MKRFVIKLQSEDTNYNYTIIKSLYQAGAQELYSFTVNNERYLTFVADVLDIEDVSTFLRSLQPELTTLDPSGFDFDEILPAIYRGEAGLDYDCIHGELDYSCYADGDSEYYN